MNVIIARSGAVSKGDSLISHGSSQWLPWVLEIEPHLLLRSSLAIQCKLCALCTGMEHSVRIKVILMVVAVGCNPSPRNNNKPCIVLGFIATTAYYYFENYVSLLYRVYTPSVPMISLCFTLTVQCNLPRAAQFTNCDGVNTWDHTSPPPPHSHTHFFVRTV